MLYKVAIVLQTLDQPCVLPVQILIEQYMCVSKDARIEQSWRSLAKEEFIISQ